MDPYNGAIDDGVFEVGIGLLMRPVRGWVYGADFQLISALNAAAG
jgi:hypothetical protein